MYSTIEAKKFTTVENKFLSAGIHENVVLESVKVDYSPNTKAPFLEVTFTKNGQKVSQTEWEPTKFSGMTDEDLQKKYKRQMSRMMQILECYYPEDSAELTFTCSSFIEFAKWVETLLNKVDKSKLLKLKVVYNDKGFTTLPSYAKYKFVEPMVLPEGKVSEIEEKDIDKFVRPVQADAEPMVNNPLQTVEPNQQAINDDLPF